MTMYKTKMRHGIEAEQFVGVNLDELAAFGAQIQFEDVLGNGDITYELWVEKSNRWCGIEMFDYIMKEPDGVGFYPCKPAIFNDRYEEENGIGDD